MLILDLLHIFWPEAVIGEAPTLRPDADDHVDYGSVRTDALNYVQAKEAGAPRGV